MSDEQEQIIDRIMGGLLNRSFRRYLRRTRHSSLLRTPLVQWTQRDFYHFKENYQDWTRRVEPNAPDWSEIESEVFFRQVFENTEGGEGDGGEGD